MKAKLKRNISIRELNENIDGIIRNWSKVNDAVISEATRGYNISVARTGVPMSVAQRNGIKANAHLIAKRFQREISIDGIVYTSIISAIKKLNTSASIMRYRLLSDNDEWKDWFYINSEHSTAGSLNNQTKVSINNVIYDSITEAAVAVGVTPTCANWRLNSKIKEWKDWFYVKSGPKVLELSKVGKPKRICVEGVIYDSFLEAAKVFKISESAVKGRVLSNNELFKNWNYFGVKPKVIVKKPTGMLVSVNGITYGSIREAANANGLNYSTVKRSLRMKLPTYDHWKFVKADSNIKNAQKGNKAVSVNGVIYVSIKEACAELNLSYRAVRQGLLNNLPKYSSWKFVKQKS